MKVKGNVTIDTACAKTAVEKRENAIIAAEDASSASMKTALTTRLTALSAAWGQTDTAAREAALKAAHSAFKGSWKTTSTTLRTARKAAWSTFKTDAKACKISIPSVEASAETSDSQM